MSNHYRLLQLGTPPQGARIPSLCMTAGHAVDLPYSHQPRLRNAVAVLDYEWKPDLAELAAGLSDKSTRRQIKSLRKLAVKHLEERESSPHLTRGLFVWIAGLFISSLFKAAIERIIEHWLAEQSVAEQSVAEQSVVEHG